MLTIATGLHHMQPKQVLLDICTESCNINNYLYSPHRPMFLRDKDTIAVVAHLLKNCNINPNTTDRYGQTPLDETNDTELIRLLLSYGAKPTSCFPRHLRHNPTDMALNLFFLGNSGAGKSTLIKAVTTQGKGISRIAHRFAKVKDVDEKTAGIIPYTIVSESLGRLTLYDFAGQKEYYAGHDALLQSMKTSPSITALVVDMRDEEEKLRENILFWFQYINNHCPIGGSQAHLTVIGSHADQLLTSERKVKQCLLQSVVSSRKPENVTLSGQIIIDCRYAESSAMSQLRSLLTQSCQALRISEEIAAAHHSFLVFLLHKFGKSPAVTLDTAAEELRCNMSSDEHLYLESLKSSDPFEMCEKLNKRGNILFMKNLENPGNSWIVLDKAILLTKVNGVIFAPEGFKEHQKLSSSTGVVPLSKLAPLFPDVNTEMIIDFLCHLEFCQEIKDTALLSLLPTESETTPASSERFFFFPGLVNLDTPQDIAVTSEPNLHYSGWALQCSKPEQFFTNRFHQVLLLRLAFGLALAPTDNSADDVLVLQRKCNIWNNGISWNNRSGCEAILEISEKKVAALICSKKKTELAHLRSSIINTVINTRKEFSSSVQVKELLILPEDAITYPVDFSKVSTVGITEVAAAVKEGKEYVLKDNDRKSTELERLVAFEPYAYLGEQILQDIFQKDSQEREITSELHFANRMNVKIQERCSLYTPNVYTPQGVSQVLQQWKDEIGRKGTRRNFQSCLDKYSIFAGRNPLLPITGKCGYAYSHYNNVIILLVHVHNV